MSLVRFFFLIFFLPLAHVYAQSARVGRVPSWVRDYPQGNVGSSPLKDMDDGYVHVLLEKQIDVATRTVYKRTILDIKTVSGVQNGSQVTVDYDPSYEQLVFHYIRIIRNGKTLNKLNPSHITLIHQEKDIDKSIYNGSLTAMIFLEDVRKGDLIDYAYSIQGRNPVFGDKFFETLEVGFAVPVTHIRYRLICPQDRPLQFHNDGSVPPPGVTSDGHSNVYEWKMDNVAALTYDEDAPSWYDPAPNIMISEYKTWKEVNDWALSLFRINGSLSGALRQKIEEIRSSSANPEKSVLAALRFVQDDVRYLGIEMGPNTHQPHDPGKVFSQRFGDCKDKALLLCTMLQALGIPASPVLINTDFKDRIREWLPAPTNFDHATVRIWLDGKFYWLDPTVSFQRGGIGYISFPDYKCGLVLTDTTTGLSSIPLQDSGQVISKEVFTLSDLSGPGRLAITSWYSGSFADEERSELNSSSLEEIQKSYAKFYGNQYKKTKVRDSLKVDEDERTGTLITHEYYTIGKLWDEESADGKASFDAVLIRSILPKFKDQERTSPLALSFPLHYTEDIEIHVPENWHFDLSPKVIRDNTFFFKSEVSSRPRVLTLKYEFQTLQDSIRAEDAAAFSDNMDKVGDGLGYDLDKDAAEGKDDTGDGQGSTYYKPSRTNIDLWEAVILGVLFTVLIVMFIKRRKK